MLDLRQKLARGLGRDQRVGQLAAGRQLQVDLGLAVVIRRNEPGGEQRYQHQRAHKKPTRCQGRPPAVLQTPAAGAHVPAHHGAVFLGVVNDGLEQIRRHHGREHARHHQRCKYRQRGRPAKLREKFAHDAAHESRWQKYRNQRESSGNHGQTNFVGRLHGRLVRRFAHAQMAHDVFNLNNRVVDQNTNHQTERQQRHHVDGKAQVVHADEGRDHRQWQRHRRDKSSTPVAQKQPHHQHRQQRTFYQQRQRCLVFLFDRCDKVKGFAQNHVRVADFELL